MYIPIWLIIIGVVAGIYFFNRSKKRDGGGLATGINNMENIFKQSFSYKLDITIDPNWTALHKKLIKPESEKEWEKLVEKKRKELEKEDDESIFGRRYHFT